jgi:hypothetical protein
MQMGTAQRGDGPAPEQKSGVDESHLTRHADVPELIEEAYLRTVSRIPTDEEEKIAAEYIAQAENPIAGLRDVLWSLLNTKEFIVNH